MAHEPLRSAGLPKALTEIVADLADLFQKELQLARAEMSAKISAKLQAGIWMSAAGLLAIVAVIFALEAIAFAIASYGIAFHWSCLIVAGATAVLALILYLIGRANTREEFTPSRTINQIKRDISAAKEQLT